MGALPIDPATLNDTDLLGLVLTFFMIAGLIALLYWLDASAAERAHPRPCDGSRCPDGRCCCGRFE